MATFLEHYSKELHLQITLRVFTVHKKKLYVKLDNRCNFSSLTVTPVLPAGDSYCPGLPGGCSPHHLTGVCSKDSLKNQVLGPRPNSLGGSEGHQCGSQQHRGVGESVC